MSEIKANGRDISAVKRSIQEQTERSLGQFHGRFNVICAEDDFSYITNTAVRFTN